MGEIPLFGNHLLQNSKKSQIQKLTETLEFNTY